MASMSPRPEIFDRRLLRARQRRAEKLGPSMFLVERVAQELSDRLATVLRRFEWAVDLGTPTDAVLLALARRDNIGSIVKTTALASRPDANSRSAAGSRRGFVVAADEEALPFAEGSIDLIASALSLQFVNDLPGTLVQIRRALKPDGLLLAALIGGDTLRELREAFATAEAEIEGGISPRVIPFVDVRAAGALLQRAGFALPVTDVDRLIVHYQSPIALMHDLRAMGATNPMLERRRHPLRRATLERVMQVYAERFGAPNSRIRATFEIVWLSGWAPHSSQPKPLTPGSARHRLADVLGTKEMKLAADNGEANDGR
jgi:SAM-dependent methyltransferase